MSLRDLTSSSLCAPTGTAAGPSSAASSANPLAHLADAVLPSSLNSAHPNSSAAATHARRNDTSSATDPLHLTHLHDAQQAQTQAQHDAALIHSATPAAPVGAAYPPIHPHQQPLHLPPLPFSNHAVLQPTHPPPPHAMPPPSVPPPAIGAPTDVFERAFATASKQRTRLTPHAAASPAPHFNVAPTAYATPAVHHVMPLPVPQMPHLSHHAMLRPSWRSINTSLSALSLHSAPHIPLNGPVSTPPTAAASSANAASSSTTASVIATASSSGAHATPMNAEEEVSAQAGVQLKTDNVNAEQLGAAHVLPRDFSWGEEFSSLEAPFQTLQGTDGVDDIMLDDSLQAAFQQMLRREAADVYQFANVRDAASKRTATDALEQGLRAHNEGRLSSAVYHLENALNRPAMDGEQLPLSKRALAWYVLGLALADLDDDERAIQALSQGIKQFDGSDVGHRREDNPHLWHSLIALAVSYTNELEHSKAQRAIREWLELRGAVNDGDGEAGVAATAPDVDLFRASDHNDLLLRLDAICREAPSDVDVHVVQGILHNLNRDFDSAAAALRHAASLRPQESKLWNKLGATLANGGDSDNALRAYRKAVDLQPALVRAWVNVGTAYANRGEFSKAIRYYLKAIAISQANGDDSVPASAASASGLDSTLHVWNYLRSTLISLSRGDLLDMVDNRNLEGLRSHFNFN